MIYVPPFILSNLRRGKLRGQLNAFVLQCELANFGQIFADLQKEGNSGPEKIARLLGLLYQECFKEVEQRGGFIARMYGDSFLALFPGADPHQVLAALDSLSTLPTSLESRLKRSGGTIPRIRLSLGYGRMEWQIFTNKLQHEYLFSGREQDLIKQLQRGNEPLLLTAGAIRKLRSQGLVDSQGNPVFGVRPEPLPHEDQAAWLDPGTLELFVHPRLRNLEPEPAFRQVTCVHVTQKLADESHLEQVIQDMELIAITFGCYVHHVLRSANKYSALILFGVPLNGGKAPYKACRSALDALKRYPNLRHGIALGTVFSGMMGDSAYRHYAVWGPVIETATQLEALAKPGEIITDAQIHKALSDQFTFQPFNKDRLPRETGKQSAYMLTGMPAPGGAARRSVFVGRKMELGRLETLIQNAMASGNNLSIRVCGDPGIGKTKLAEEVLSSATANECRSFELWCDLASPPMEPMRQLFRQIFPLDPELDPQHAASAFSRIWRNWADKDKGLLDHESFVGAILGLRWSRSLRERTPPELLLEKIFEAGALTLQELARRQPLLIHIDDLQWIDSQSREFFQRLKSSQPGMICILATTRYLEDGSVPILELDGFESHRIDLGPLDVEDALDLYRSLLGLASLPTASEQFIKEQTRGNPFAIEQIVAIWLEEGSVNARGEMNLPAGWKQLDLQDVLVNRIDRLSAKTRECIDNASVLGMRFNIQVLSQMLHSDARRELAHGAQNRLWKDLGEVFYIFSHVLIQEAAYSRIVSDELRKLHLSAAQAMEKVFELELAEHAEEIAQHYEKAGLPEKAAHYYDRAADRNCDGSFFDRAETNSRKAVALSSESCGTASAEYGEYLFHQALLYHYLLRYREAEPLYLEVMRIARKIHGPRSVALSPYLNNLGRFYKDTGRYSEGE